MAITFGASTTVNIATAASTWSINSSGVLTSTAGDDGALLLLSNNSSVATVSAVTDNAGNSWGQAIASSRVSGVSSGHAAVWLTNKYAPSTLISVTMSGSCSGTMTLARFTRLGAFDGGVSSAATGQSTTHSAGNYTPSTTNCLVVSFGRLHASSVGGNITPAGYSTLTSTNVQVRHPGYYKIQTTSSNETGQWTTSSNSPHSIVLAAFREYSSIVLPDWGAMLMMGVQ